ncbi:MAG: DUF4363 family protein [Clostridia bacterium]|nr:DUF4363 family protein [Clostridia bacterium]
MKRVAAAVFLIVTAVSLSVWSSFVFNAEMDSLLRTIDGLIDFSESCSSEELEEKTEILLAEWEKSSKLLHSLVMHEGMDMLEEDITSLPLIIEHSDREEFKKKCIEAINQIENLINAEKINIENIF